jgi:hypothetical protein
MLGSLLSWEGCEPDDPSVRISQNYTLDSKELLPGCVKTSKGIIPPREIYYTQSSIESLKRRDWSC